MPDLKHHFDSEMRELQRAGARFAKEHPDAARRLSLEEGEDCDPHVEQLLEGFAFLTARIRQSLDNEEDGLASHLLNLVAPGIDAPLPSVAQVEFCPRPAEFSQVLELTHGHFVDSSPVPGLQRACHFSLMQDLTLAPIALVEASLSEDSGTVLKLALEHWGKPPFAHWPDPLPVFLHGDPAATWAMRHWLLRKADHPILEVDGIPSPGVNVRLETLESVSAGIGAEPALRTLCAFLNNEDSFRYFTIRGLSRIQARAGERHCLRIGSAEAFPRAWAQEVGTEMFRLHTVPVVNAFPENCEPVVMDLTQLEYPLVARTGADLEILEVLEVTGSRNDGTRRNYRPFGAPRPRRFEEHEPFYEIVKNRHRSRNSASLVVGDLGSEMPEPETLSVRALCCDGELPRHFLQAADLNVPDARLPASLEVRGLTRPSSLLRPPDQGSDRWRLLGHFRSSLGALLEPGRLQGLLHLMHWDERESRRRLINGIADVTFQRRHRITRGVAFPETEITISLRDEACDVRSWDRLGQLDVLARRLWELFDEAAPLGSALRLRLLIEPSGVVLEHPWP